MMIKVGTRKSALAVAQTMLALEEVKSVNPGLLAELVMKQTMGDRILDRPLLSFGGKGVFVSEFEESLQSKIIDIAVHSAKDLPMELGGGLMIVGIPRREDPRDVLVTMAGHTLLNQEEVVIGTSSLRRKLQIQELAPVLFPGSKISCRDLRGNVNTRLSKLAAGEFDAVLLAAAGLKRLGLHQDQTYEFHYFDCQEFIPAGGQGILALEGREEDAAVRAAVEKINHRETAVSLLLERDILKRLDAGCHEPIGVYSEVKDRCVKVWGICSRDDQVRRISLDGDISKLEELAERAAEGLR